MMRGCCVTVHIFFICRLNLMFVQAGNVLSDPDI